MKILFTGGGTAGHIMPIIAVAREVKKIYNKEKIRMYYVGPKDEFGVLLLSQENIKIKNVFAGKIRRYRGLGAFFQNFFDIVFKIPFGTLQAFFNIFFIAPDLIFSKGGYGALPATVAGWILHIPIFLHESDVVPGRANVLLSRFAKEIFVSFPVKQIEQLPINKLILTGNPVRQELLSGNFQQAKEYFNLTGEKPVVLIMGGSQGAQKINEMVLEILPKLLQEFEVIHQCGDKKFKQVQEESKVMINSSLEKYYHLFPFLREHEMRNAYAACQVVASRAGANSIFELAAAGLPSILIPLPESAQNHQLKNAYAYSENGACIVIEESNLAPHFFLEKLKFITLRSEEMKKMRNAAQEFSTPQAARIIAEYLLSNLM